MAVIQTQPAARELKTPVRNRYFHGKLLDVYHFQLESDYMNAKRHLLNRLVSGYGVVCGLDVKCEPDGRHVVVEPGVAIDKWGREIVVPERTRPIPIPEHLLVPESGENQGYQKPQKPGYPKGEERPEDDEGGFRVMLCYYECDSDPTPVMAGDCGTVDECAAGSIRERYRITFKEGPAPPIRLHCRIPDLFHGDRLDYEALARHVTEGCPEPPTNPCIPLANLRPGDDGCDPDRIDTTIRPVVYSNDLLLEIILSLLEEGRDRHAK
jgi:hypothetical protein